MSLLSQLASQVRDRSQAANRQVAAQCIAQPEQLREIVAALKTTNVALLGDCHRLHGASIDHADLPGRPSVQR
jgi:hypothetical protein